MKIFNVHLYQVYDAVDYDDVGGLFPVSELPPRAVARATDAVQLIERTADERIVAVAPVSTATGYRLAQAPVTAIRLDRLDRSPLASATLDRPASGYRVVVFGRTPARENWTLREYAE